MQNTGHSTSLRSDVLHVAVAVIVSHEHKVLIAQRPDHVHQGGYWEFPGGKVEQGEAVFDALCREINEELQLRIKQAQPFIKITHHYQDKSVLLDVWQVTEYEGSAQGAEGQPLQWQSIHDLSPGMFPAANRKIISALQLPDRLLITGHFSSSQDYAANLAGALQSGIRLVQLRCKSRCDSVVYQEIVNLSKDMCENYRAGLVLNSDPELANELNLGLHLNSRDMYHFQHRPIAANRLLSVSCHNLADLQQAELLQADFALLSPVKATPSHPDAIAMGWGEFARLTSTNNVPVYALGGMQVSDIKDARQMGAQGIAAISAFWSGK